MLFEGQCALSAPREQVISAQHSYKLTAFGLRDQFPVFFGLNQSVLTSLTPVYLHIFRTPSTDNVLQQRRILQPRRRQWIWQ